MLKSKEQRLPGAKTFAQYHVPVDYRDTWRVFRIMAEFVDGYQFLGQFQRTITFFGSARLKEDSPDYLKAQKTAFLLGQAGFDIITGGGPGIMEAANKGASEAGAESIGINIQLPHEQVVNKYVKKSLGFHYFFSRKVMLTSPAQAAVCFPGGFGTLDEFFELVDLMEINKIRKFPVVLVGKKFWQPLVDFLKNCSLSMIGAIKDIDLSLFQLVDTPEEAAEIIKASKISKKLCDPTVEDCGANLDWRIFRIMAELVEGFEFLSREIHHDDVTILGTKSIDAKNPYYQLCYEFSKTLGKRGYTIITGGGPGIMEAANKGASEAGAQSLGLEMRMDHEVRTNPYVKRGMSFYFPFTRKLIITMPSLAFVFFPGGFGTLHQLFEVLTLMQTGKTGEQMRVILYGRKFWAPLDKFIKEKLAKEYGVIEEKDAELYQIADTVVEAVKLVPRFERNKK